MRSFVICNLRQVSDLNYLVRVTRNKEIVVNVNKMKPCYQETYHFPSIPADTLPSELNHNHLANSDSTVPIPPGKTNDTGEDQVEQEQIRDGGNELSPLYNLRPLPGRNF
jgi:hypothetical protein